MFTLFYDEIIVCYLLADDDKDKMQQKTGKKEHFGGMVFVRWICFGYTISSYEIPFV